MKTEELIAQVQAGDAKTWAILVGTYFNFVFHLVEKWLAPSLVDTDTIKQETVAVFNRIKAGKLAGCIGEVTLPVHVRRMAQAGVLAFCKKRGLEFKFQHDIPLDTVDRVLPGLASREKLGLRLYGLMAISISEAAEYSGITNKRLAELIGALRGGAAAETDDEGLFKAQDGKSTQQVKG
ncbi:MAG: hypothetical protein ABIF71_14080 [Planctomycetota bacterium]